MLHPLISIHLPGRSLHTNIPKKNACNLAYRQLLVIKEFSIYWMGAGIASGFRCRSSKLDFLLSINNWVWLGEQRIKSAHAGLYFKASEIYPCYRVYWLNHSSSSGFFLYFRFLISMFFNFVFVNKLFILLFRFLQNFCNFCVLTICSLLGPWFWMSHFLFDSGLWVFDFSSVSRRDKLLERKRETSAGFYYFLDSE